MIEAVGHQFLDEYFRVLNQRLKPEGLLLLQAMQAAIHSAAEARHAPDAFPKLRSLKPSSRDDARRARTL